MLKIESLFEFEQYIFVTESCKDKKKNKFNFVGIGTCSRKDNFQIIEVHFFLSWNNTLMKFRLGRLKLTHTPKTVYSSFPIVQIPEFCKKFLREYCGDKSETFWIVN